MKLKIPYQAEEMKQSLEEFDNRFYRPSKEQLEKVKPYKHNLTVKQLMRILLSKLLNRIFKI